MPLHPLEFLFVNTISHPTLSPYPRFPAQEPPAFVKLSSHTITIMAPPSATTDIADSGASVPSSKSEQTATASLEVGLSTEQAEASEFEAIPKLPTEFKDPYKEREYQKGRLALAFRIFAKYGFDEGVAGHITLRVCCFPYKHINGSEESPEFVLGRRMRECR